MVWLCILTWLQMKCINCGTIYHYILHLPDNKILVPVPPLNLLFIQHMPPMTNNLFTIYFHVLCVWFIFAVLVVLVKCKTLM